jgi:nitroreductase
MNPFFDLIRRRRSIRRFENRPVAPEKIQQLMEAALRAPSSRGTNPWEFVVVTDPSHLDALSRSKAHGASFLKEAPVGIVVLADPGQTDVWVEDGSIATIFLHLAAESLGLGSCWIQIRRRTHTDGRPASDHIRQLLAIPDTREVQAILAVGYGAETKAGHPETSLQREKIHYHRYGTHSF